MRAGAWLLTLASVGVAVVSSARAQGGEVGRAEAVDTECATTECATTGGPPAVGAATNGEFTEGDGPQEVDPEAPHDFTLTISGGLSLGNYEAGMNWALLEARKRTGGYRLRAWTGASADLLARGRPGTSQGLHRVARLS